MNTSGPTSWGIAVIQKIQDAPRRIIYTKSYESGVYKGEVLISLIDAVEYNEETLCIMVLVSGVWFHFKTTDADMITDIIRYYRNARHLFSERL